MWMERAAFADLGADDMPTQERDAECKASQEVASLFNWLCGELGLAPALHGMSGAKVDKITQSILKVQLATLTLLPHGGDRVADMSLGFRPFVEREGRWR
jgi:hypothetical protein